MKKEKYLLDAIGDIDDRFVAEAMPERAEKEFVSSSDLTDDMSDISVKTEQNAPDLTIKSSNMTESSDDDPSNKENVSDKSTLNHQSDSDHVIYMKRPKTLKPFGAIAAAIILIIGVGIYMTVFNDNRQSMAPSVLSDEAAVEGAMEEAEEFSEDNAASTGSQKKAGIEENQLMEAQAEDNADGNSPKITMEMSPESTFSADDFASDGISEESSEKGTAQTKMRVLEDSEDAADSSAFARIGDPWTESDTLEAAMANAGFDMAVPETFDGCKASTYRSMTGNMLEIIYVAEEDNEAFRIRKSAQKGDISGDYNDYEREYDVDIKNMSVTLKGDADYIYNVTWFDGAYSFAITVSDGMQFDEETVRELVRQIS